jgi:hypothetical protein
MDEKLRKRRWLQFGLRDLLWAVALAAAVLGWRADRRVYTQPVIFQDMLTQMRGMNKDEVREVWGKPSIMGAPNTILSGHDVWTYGDAIRKNVFIKFDETGHVDWVGAIAR